MLFDRLKGRFTGKCPACGNFLETTEKLEKVSRSGYRRIRTLHCSRCGWSDLQDCGFCRMDEL
ncbi:hypothetical protein FGU65_14460 [Methanoculleus sp. FWC-SCC1]|uniref:Uncharacterized protein n=1 Tax=Methanoculleus frigidifontis TaxID=2584085 RepID=A0ABT8MDP0_9EURY|nr:hypothetical protein [Methanoculleus sp. FWC-SCC1]MDN7026068.1 hypothetical protein [Methanoculleus sp. FWC-SCC1]